MDSLAPNPDISRQMVANNSMFAGNPKLREQMLNQEENNGILES